MNYQSQALPKTVERIQDMRISGSLYVAIKMRESIVQRQRNNLNVNIT